MSVWDELGIKKTRDLRSIKVAYAKRLKVTRPDENPESFQRLHFAYKKALAIAKANPDEANGDIGQSMGQLDEVALGPENDTAPPSSSDVRDQGERERQEKQAYAAEEWERLISRAKALLSDPNELHQVDNWRFFERSPMMLEVGFNQQLSVAVFYLLTEHQRLARKYYRLSNQVVTYLNTVFCWNRDVRYFYSEFGQHAAERMFRMVEDYAEPAPEYMGLRGGKRVVSESPRLDASAKNGNSGGQSEEKKDIIGYVIAITFFLLFLVRVFDWAAK